MFKMSSLSVRLKDRNECAVAAWHFQNPRLSFVNLVEKNVYIFLASR